MAQRLLPKGPNRPQQALLMISLGKNWVGTVSDLGFAGFRTQEPRVPRGPQSRDASKLTGELYYAREVQCQYNSLCQIYFWQLHRLAMFCRVLLLGTVLNRCHNILLRSPRAATVGKTSLQEKHTVESPPNSEPVEN